MNVEVTHLAGAVVVGLGATLFMDIWALFAQRAFGIPPANYCLVGRWICYMPEGKFAHESIAAAPLKRAECAVGWLAHYVVGVLYALTLIAIVSGGWLAQPTLLPAVVFGIATVLVPYLIMQPSFGLGIAGSKTPQPTQVRLRSLMAHTVFGFGLYVGGVSVSYVL